MVAGNPYLEVTGRECQQIGGCSIWRILLLFSLICTEIRTFFSRFFVIYVLSTMSANSFQKLYPVAFRSPLSMGAQPKPRPTLLPRSLILLPPALAKVGGKMRDSGDKVEPRPSVASHARKDLPSRAPLILTATVCKLSVSTIMASDQPPLPFPLSLTLPRGRLC